MIELAPSSESRMSYDEALLYCQFCNHNGYTDWRLPTAYEYFRGPASHAIELSWYVDIDEPYIDVGLPVVPVRDI
jgi:hypothetical protein